VKREREKTLRNLVNSSGFLFQLGVEHQIRESQSLHEWTVMSREHPWKNPETGEEGFVDLVLGKRGGRAVIECKRPRDATWVFLVDSHQSEERKRVRCLWVECEAGQRSLLGWHDFLCAPASPESDFCVIRGKGEGDQPMLERLSGVLLRSLECLAEEELQFPFDRDFFHWEYLPIIVTTAKLEMCRFDPREVSPKNGKIQGGEFEPIPFIRFRKSLTTTSPPDTIPRTLKEAGEHRKRTVFVVNASEVTVFLKELACMIHPMDELPWDLVRRDESNIPEKKENEGAGAR